MPQCVWEQRQEEPVPCRQLWGLARRGWQTPAAQVGSRLTGQLSPGGQQEWGSSLNCAPQPTPSPASLLGHRGLWGGGGIQSPSRGFSPVLKCHDPVEGGRLILTWMPASQPAHTAFPAQGQLGLSTVFAPHPRTSGKPGSTGCGQVLPTGNTADREAPGDCPAPAHVHEGNRRHNLFSGCNFISP